MAVSHYQYLRDRLPLDIEMRYAVNWGLPGNGLNVKLFIQLYSSTPPSSGQLAKSLHQKVQPGVGFYYLFAFGGRAYLSSCIKSRGGTTVTEAQFQRNRYLYDLKLSRLFAWLLGQGTVRDTHCLWTHLSMPANTSAPEAAYHTLEQVWFDWYKWWLPRFSTS